MDRLTFDGDFCTLAMCQHQVCPYDGACDQKKTWERLKEYEDIMPLDRVRELAQADKDGRLVVLPFPVHSILVNMSDVERPELLKDFRISATWTHCGIVFHSPWGIFNGLVEDGSIKRVTQETEAALKGGNGE